MLFPDHPRRQLSAARVADRSREARQAVPAARAREGAVAGSRAVPRRGAGRRDAPGDQGPGGRRARHHHRRRDPARELLEPVRDGARGRGPRQPGQRARPVGSSEPGAPRHREDPAPAPGGGGGRQVPPVAHEEEDQDHRAGTVHDVASRRRTTSIRPRTRWRWTMPPRSTRRSGISSPPAPTSCRSTSRTCRRGPRRRACYGLKRAQPRARGHHRARRACTSASAMRRSSTSGRPATRSCPSCPGAAAARSRSRPRSRTSIARSWRRCRASKSCSA